MEIITQNIAGIVSFVIVLLLSVYFIHKFSNSLTNKKVYAFDPRSRVLVETNYFLDSNLNVTNGINKYNLNDFVFYYDNNKLVLLCVYEQGELIPISFILNRDKLALAIEEFKLDMNLLNNLFEKARVIEEFKNRSVLEKLLSNRDVVFFSVIVFLSSVLIVFPVLMLFGNILNNYTTTLESAVELIKELKNSTVVIE
ncbi:MAG: hypothetical protein QXM92_02735 [Candidatus Anstonellales archaeon]